MPAILRVCLIAVALADSVAVVAAILAVIGGILLVPELGVERAVSAVGDVIDGEQIGVEEVLSPCDKEIVSVLLTSWGGGRKRKRKEEDAYASIIGAVGSGMTLVIGCVGSAGRSTFSCVVHSWEILDAHISVFAGGSFRSVDGSAELIRTFKPILGPGRGFLGVS